MSDPGQNKSSIDRGYRHDPRVRAAAYDWWSTDGRRNAAETAEHFGVPVTTVRSWARSESWELRAARERLSSVPDQIYEILATEIAATAVLGAQYRREVLEGTRQPDRLMTLIANTAIADMGFVAPKDSCGVELGKHSARGIDTPKAEMLAKMTPDQIRAYEQGRNVELPTDTVLIEIPSKE